VRVTGQQLNRISKRVARLSLFSLLGATAVACSAGQKLLPLVVDVPGRTMSKLPFVIALDQGLYEKHGLDVELRLPPPEFEEGIQAQPRFVPRVLRRLGLQEEPPPDIIVNGHTPQMVRQIRDARAQKLVALAATDCSVRSYVIGRPGIKSLQELKGRRLGLNNDASTSGFAGLRMIQRMGWDRVRDISIMSPGGIGALGEGLVDAIVGDDEEFEAAEREGFKILEDTGAWKESLAGNSVLASTNWLQDSTHREAARRFLMATSEAVAMFHTRPALVLDVLGKWYGMNVEIAESRYNRTDYIPRKPYPCYDGIKNTMQLHDSNEMRRYRMEDFYDDSLIRDLDERGLFDDLYD
jgi:ABC-type nitrate/sulfonate/bicarbonate transport system substrate-binding protein